MLYATFQVHSVLTDVSFLSDSQMSAVLEENLLKLLIFPGNAWSPFFIVELLCQHFKLLCIRSHTMLEYDFTKKWDCCASEISFVIV